ncbi:MAG: mechanosensitive ion channel family protein [Bacteroidetes bacterium]|nr:mechanosensitive ion channel family protein [Bacteroidota bacterium]
MGNEFLIIMEDYWHDILKFLPRVSLAVIVLIVFLILKNKTAKLFHKKVIKYSSDVFLADIISKIAKWVFLLIGFIIALNILGLAGFAGGMVTGAGISAVVLGLAFKNIGENFVSGVILAFQRPFEVGDVIVSSEYTGSVTSVGLRTTNIKTFDGNDIYIPNSLILNNPLINYSRDSVRRFDFTVQLDYGIDVNKVRKLILEVLGNYEDILKEPKSVVSIDNLTSNVVVKCFYWLDTDKLRKSLLETKGEIIEFCLDTLTKNNLDVSDVSQIRLTNDILKIESGNFKTEN